MSNKVVISEREELLADEITKLYNSGQCKAGVEKSVDFLREFPNSYLARYKYAVMHGDYSYSSELSEEVRKIYREIGNNGVKDLAEDPQFKSWPIAFQYRVRNEYYWFFELHKEQYELGIERISLGEPGHYSASVGASMMALKTLKELNVPVAEGWAKKSYEHFIKFEEYAPHWYNVNIFAAQALACLGKYDESLLCYKDMYRKQQSPINELAVTIFLDKIADIKRLRNL